MLRIEVSWQYLLCVTCLQLFKVIILIFTQLSYSSFMVFMKNITFAECIHCILNEIRNCLFVEGR